MFPIIDQKLMNTVNIYIILYCIWIYHGFEQFD